MFPRVFTAYCIFFSYHLICPPVCVTPYVALLRAGLHNVSVTVFPSRRRQLSLRNVSRHTLYVVENVLFTQPTVSRVEVEAEMKCDVRTVFPAG